MPFPILLLLFLTIQTPNTPTPITAMSRMNITITNVPTFELPLDTAAVVGVAVGDLVAAPPCAEVRVDVREGVWRGMR